MTPIHVTEQSPADLAAYATVPIAFVLADGSTTKDYDAIPGHHPTDWPARFDLTHWRFAAAHIGATRVGNATVILDPAGLDVAAGHGDTAVLWDLRVHPDHRRGGVGRALLAWAEATAAAAGRRRLTIETQDVNVAARRFYAGRGYACVAVNRLAYPELPAETQLIYGKRLG